MKPGLPQWFLLSVIGLAASGMANASSPAEKLVCTDAPRSEWMSEAKAREVFGAKGYAQVKFKVSRGNCYEFYAVHRDGSIVEAYYHPVSGEALRFNRVSAAIAAPAYESRSPALSADKP
ncbi:MAG: PepSY domain-containing protein [Azonexus sp.]